MNKITKNAVLENSLYIPENALEPVIHESAAIRNSQITGNITVRENVHIINAVLRADEGTPFFIGKNSNIQDFCTLHGYATRKNNNNFENLLEINGEYYSIYIGEHVSISHGALVHGPSYVGDNTFIGFKATVDGAVIGKNVEIGAHSYIKNVKIPDNISIFPNSVILKQEDVEKFIADPTGINLKIVAVNLEMTKAYKQKEAVKEEKSTPLLL